MRAAVVILGVLLVVVVLGAMITPFFLAPNWEWHGPWMWGWGGWWMPFMMLFMGLFWIIVIALLVLLGVWLFRQLQAPAAASGARDGNALRIAQERYARGEISREEYEQLRRDLQG